MMGLGVAYGERYDVLYCISEGDLISGTTIVVD
jgi:hypothetical protein